MRAWLGVGRRVCAGVLVLGVLPASVAAASSGGQLYAFGDNYYGGLGNKINLGTVNPNPRPARLALPGATGPVVKVAAGFEFSLAVTSTGQLYAFGDNEYGQLGSAINVGTVNPNPTPRRVVLPGATGPVVQVAAGRAHSLAVTSTGQVYSFGENESGELGRAAGSGTYNANPRPTRVVFRGETGRVVRVAAGGDSGFSLAVTSTGQLYGFGDNGFGELGRANGINSPNPRPERVVLPGATGGVNQAAAGGEYGFSLVVTSTGQLYSFGANESGELGRTTNLGSYSANPRPERVLLPGATGRVVRVAAGDGIASGFSLAVTSTGQLYAFGDNSFGELGRANGINRPNPRPERVVLPSATGRVVQVSAGGDYSFSLAVTSTGNVYSFGANDEGQLGRTTNLGTVNPNPRPERVWLPAGVRIARVAADPFGEHALAITAR
jgi:alpha-tubulin suppressor-like RCC1 family protein